MSILLPQGRPQDSFVRGAYGQRVTNNYIWVCDRLTTVTIWRTYGHKHHHVCEFKSNMARVFRISSVNQSNMAAGCLMPVW